MVRHRRAGRKVARKEGELHVVTGPAFLGKREKRLDRITISGDVDLTADRRGRPQPGSCLPGQVLARLEQQALPDHLRAPDVRTDDNPFQ
jgi:hypothetical protein